MADTPIPVRSSSGTVTFYLDAKGTGGSGAAGADPWQVRQRVGLAPEIAALGTGPGVPFYVARVDDAGNIAPAGDAVERPVFFTLVIDGAVVGAANPVPVRTIRGTAATAAGTAGSGTATLILAANPARTFASIINTSPATGPDLKLVRSPTATAGEGYVAYPRGGGILDEFSTSAWYGITESGEANWYAEEVESV